MQARHQIGWRILLTYMGWVPVRISKVHRCKTLVFVETGGTLEKLGRDGSVFRLQLCCFGTQPPVCGRHRRRSTGRLDASEKPDMSASTSQAPVSQGWEVVCNYSQSDENSSKPTTAIRRSMTDASSVRLRSQAGDLEQPATSLLQHSARKMLQRQRTWSRSTVASGQTTPPGFTHVHGVPMVSGRQSADSQVLSSNLAEATDATERLSHLASTDWEIL